MNHAKIGVVIADDMEFAPLLKRAKRYGLTHGRIHSFESASFSFAGKEITAVRCGDGKVNAAASTALLIEREKPCCIINIGLSGGVKNVNRGTIFAGTSFMECDFDLSVLGYKKGEKPGQDYVYEADKELLSKIPQDLGLRLLKCGTGDFFITKDSVKEEFYRLFGINAFDMETGAIASVCHTCSVPFLSIRKISDDSEDSAAKDYRQMNNLAETALSDIMLRVIENL